MSFLNRHISNRIREISSLARPKWPTYDLCCDHGMIGLWILESKNSSSLTLVDCVHQIVQRLDEKIAKFGALLPIETQTKDAGKVTISEQQANVIIAGVGARKIIEILKSLYPDGFRDHNLILNPAAPSKELETFLVENGLNFSQKKVTENNQTHSILWGRSSGS